MAAFPVEYKRGKPKPDHSDKVQLMRSGAVLGGNAQVLLFPLARSSMAKPGGVSMSTLTKRCGWKQKTAAIKTHELN